MADAKLKARLASLGSSPFVVSDADFDTFIAAEIDKWGKVIRTANIKPN